MHTTTSPCSGTLDRMTARRALLALTAALALAGCSGSSAAVENPPAPTASYTANMADVAYLAAVRPQVQGSTDADLIALGRKACASFAESGAATALQVTDEFVGQGFTSAAAAAITTAAVTSYCPEYRDDPANS